MSEAREARIDVMLIRAYIARKAPGRLEKIRAKRRAKQLAQLKALKELRKLRSELFVEPVDVEEIAYQLDVMKFGEETMKTWRVVNSYFKQKGDGK